MYIEPLDAVAGPDADVRAVAELHAALDREALPGEPVDTVELRYRALRLPLSFEPTWHWVARTDNGEVIGHSSVEFEQRGDNARLAWVELGVRPEFRRQHVACRLLVPLLEAAAEAGRTLLCFGLPEGGPGAGFLTAMGATKKLVERHSVLRLDDVDRSLLESWVVRAKERASDYSLVSWDGPPPADLLQSFTAVTNVMNTAPMDDFEYEDFVNTPEMVREETENRVALGELGHTIAARHGPTGELVGFTALELSTLAPERAWQADTAVDPAHRNKGIGRWLKAAMLLHFLDERPQLHRIETDNAGSNGPMLGINIALGFEVLKWQAEWQVELPTLRDAVRDRLGVSA